MYLIIDWRNSHCLLKQRKCEIAQTVVYEPNGDIGMSLLSTFVSTSLPAVALFGQIAIESHTVVVALLTVLGSGCDEQNQH